MLCVAGWARAEDFQIGGEQQDETVVPLEIRPSLGLYVQAYVNGYGPYRFGIGMFGHTALTSAVVRDAGLASEAKGLTLAGNSNQLAQNKQLVDGTLRLGDRNFSLKGARIIPERNLSAYVPVQDYGGELGIELFRNKVVRIDLSHSQLVLSERSEMTPRPGAIEVELHQSAVGVDLDREPGLIVSLDGQRGMFRLEFGSESVEFLENSALGRDLFEKSVHPVSRVIWTPDGLVNGQSSTVDEITIGGYLLGRGTISRSTDPLPSRLSRRSLPFDGVIGLSVLGRFDITIDNLAGKAWLERRDRKSYSCQAKPSGAHRGITGLVPWLYNGQGIVSALVHGSPAEAAGIQPGDAIVSINDGTVLEYYQHLDATCLAPEPVKVEFHNASGDHIVMLTPAVL